MRKTSFLRSAFLMALAPIVVGTGCSTSAPVTSGSLQITVAGAPGGQASLIVSGPSGFLLAVYATSTLTGLVPGVYTILAQNVVVSNATYGVTPASSTVTVVASNSPATASVSYALVSGALAITITGLPSGVPASIAVTGPGGFSQTITGTGTLSNLLVGSYTLTPNPVSQGAGAATYGDTLPPVVAVVPASLTPVAVGVPYMLLTGQIAVTVNAPSGVSPSVLVTGPAGYTRPITAAGVTTLTGLSLGSYTVAANAVTLGGITYSPPSVTPTRTLNAVQRSWADTINYEMAMLTIAFASGTGIDAINADGSGLASLTSATDTTPVWSPDGTKIAFVSTRDGNSEIYLMNANGSGQTNLTNNPGNDYMPVWSPDGTKIAFESVRDGNSEIYVMRADGSGQVNLTGNPADDFHPSWSPDGKKIAFESHRDGNAEIYVMNADGAGQVNLTNTNDLALDALPAWSPDGTRIAFLSSRNGQGLAIYAMQADGTGVTELDPVLANSEVHPTIYRTNSGPVWSPHGTKIAFLITEKKSFGGGFLLLTSLYVMNGDGSSLRPLLRVLPSPGGSEPGDHTGASSIPTWSPDETAIAFTKYFSGVWVAHVDGTGASQVHQSGADSSPAWRP